MGFFAVLCDERYKQGASPDILLMHLNFWVLAGPSDAGQPEGTYFCDVGIHLQASAATAITEFALALPFPTQKIQDLSRQLLTGHVAELVFGEPADVLAGDVIKLRGGREFHVHSAQTSTSEPQSKLTTPSASLWNVKLNRRIEPGAKGYVRVRFFINDPARVWSWKVGGRGGLLDIRVASPSHLDSHCTCCSPRFSR